MSDSEDESPTMTVIQKKTKKPRSEAQKKATAKALEILNQRRAEKWKLKQAELEAREQVQKEAMIAEAKEDERRKLESRKKPVPVVTKAVEPTTTSDSADFLSVLSDLRDEVKSLHKKVAVKPKKVRIIDDESDEAEAEEEVVIRKKKVIKKPVENTPEPPPEPPTRPGSNLRSLFFRNQ
jgi:hypothetical protein